MMVCQKNLDADEKSKNVEDEQHLLPPTLLLTHESEELFFFFLFCSCPCTSIGSPH